MEKKYENKANRHVAYKLAYNMLLIQEEVYNRTPVAQDIRRWYGICVCLPGNIKDIYKNFPEFMDKQPKKNHGGVELAETQHKGIYYYWWDPSNLEIRKQVLTECMEETS